MVFATHQRPPIFAHNEDKQDLPGRELEVVLLRRLIIVQRPVQRDQCCVHGRGG